MLVEAKTYRYRGHSRTDPAKYRPEGELEAWKLRDPITLLGATLGLSDDDQAAIRDGAQRLVDETADRAKSAPTPTLEEIEAYVYAS